MKIIFVSRLFYPHIGGVEKHIYKISKVLLEKGYDITVITEKYDEGLEDYEVYEGIIIYRVPVGVGEEKKKWIIWSWLWQHRQLFEKADVVHCHDVFFWYLPFRFLYPLKNVYTTFHGYETKFPPARKAILVRKLSEIFSRGNICIGEYICKWYGTKSTFISYGGIDAQEFIKLTTAINEKLQILFVGRIEEDNGVRFYEKVLENLRKQKIPFSFTSVGEGSLRDNFEKYGKVMGFKKEFIKDLDNANILFASSYLSILEGLSKKKLVMSTYDNPLKKDYLEMTPFAPYITVESDPEKLVEQISSFLSHPQEKEGIVEEGYAWVKTQTWERVAKLYEKLWNEI